MHPYVAALGISGLLVLAGGAVSLVADAQPEEELPAFVQAARASDGHGGGAHAWSGGTGTIPTDTTGLDRRGAIIIEGDAAFNPANGVRSGSGTFEDPFVISGWQVDQVYIRDTTKAFELKENYISDILILDWTGTGGYVHHNYINNLRTNRNVERTGDPSASVIETNRISRVEELRHFDGVLANNTIGRAPLLGLVDTDGAVALNIAGLNGAGIHDNLILGGVDMKIHGHHHSDKEGAHSHNHGQADEEQAEDHVEDHQVRYIDFLFYNNTIRDSGFGLRYNDLGHAGDDRTATSEQEPDLELPHTHYTRVALVNNVVDGAQLRISVLNAKDERHVGAESAELVIMQNRILKPKAGDGLVVESVRNARVVVEGNRVEKGEDLLPVALGESSASGILLYGFQNATVELANNWLGPYRYGIRAAEFDANTTWSVGPNDAAGVEHPVYWDDSVANAPEGGAAQADAHAHDHGDRGGDAAAAPSVMQRLPGGLRLR